MGSFFKRGLERVFLWFFSFFYTDFLISNVSVGNGESLKRIHKYQLNSNKIEVTKKGIIFYGLYIPYEYIIEFGTTNKQVIVSVFCSCIEQNQQITLLLGKERLSLSFESNNSIILVKMIKYNMENYFFKSSCVPKHIEYSV
jgi:hypothetical protein